MSDLVKKHIEAVLNNSRRIADAKLTKIAALEAQGKKIVTGGQVSREGWEISDWRTGEVLAHGEDGLDGYDAAYERLDPDNAWYHVDGVEIDGAGDYVTPPDGLPESLAKALEDWIDSLDTDDEDIAEFIGWPVEKVNEYR